MRDRQFPFTSSTLPASELSPTLTAIRFGRSTPQAPTPHALCSTTVPAHSNEPCITVRMPSDGKSTPHASDVWSLRMIRSLPGSVSNEKAWKPR